MNLDDLKGFILLILLKCTHIRVSISILIQYRNVCVGVVGLGLYHSRGKVLIFKLMDLELPSYQFGSYGV